MPGSSDYEPRGRPGIESFRYPKRKNEGHCPCHGDWEHIPDNPPSNIEFLKTLSKPNPKTQKVKFKERKVPEETSARDAPEPKNAAYFAQLSVPVPHHVVVKYKDRKPPEKKDPHDLPPPKNLAYFVKAAEPAPRNVRKKYVNKDLALRPSKR